MKLRVFWSVMALGCLGVFPARADDQGTTGVGVSNFFDEGKLIASGGVSNIEGAGGGGLTTWALISGYGTRDGVGIDAHYTYVGLPNYNLQSPGVAFDLFDRLELSYAYAAFNTQTTGRTLGLGDGYEFHQNTVGIKVKILGDAIYDQDRWYPQIAAGIQYKSNDRGTVIRAIGGRSSTGLDYYVSATKIFLEQSVLVDATLRLTRANQFGILGFGGDKNDSYTPQFEGSIAYLVSPKFAIGAELRTKPDNLSRARENNAFDIFAAYFISKNVSCTLAYVDLGNIVIHDNQSGVYVSLQGDL